MSTQAAQTHSALGTARPSVSSQARGTVAVMDRVPPRTPTLLISDPGHDIMGAVRQLLLRVPEDLHRRIAARAAREGRSMNAVAGAILDAATDADLGAPPTPQERLRARAAALGMLSEATVRPVSETERERIIASTRGLGPIVDRLIREDRADRL
jgi:plasmid stability protein